MTTHNPDAQMEKNILALWSTYRLTITATIMAILLSVVAYSAYQQYLERISVQAASAYYLIVPAFEKSDTNPAIEQVHDIQEHHPQSIYAALSTLHLVKHYVSVKEYHKAIEALEWIESHSTDQLPTIAKLKRARLYLELKKPEKALAITQDNPFYSAENALIQGDAYFALQQYPQAKAAYKQAMKSASPSKQYSLQNIAKMKYNQLNMIGDSSV